jgi:hypothetical protein
MERTQKSSEGDLKVFLNVKTTSIVRTLRNGGNSSATTRNYFPIVCQSILIPSFMMVELVGQVGQRENEGVGYEQTVPQETDK